MLLFMIIINTLSLLLQRICDSYNPGEHQEREGNITHLMRADNLNTLASWKETALKQAKLITMFSTDKCM